MRGYDVFMWPLETLVLKSIRKSIIKQATGVTLEIGFATGVNVPYYQNVTELHALDIHENMKHYDHVQYHILSAEKLPFEDKLFDTVVMSLALCTIEKPEQAIQEIKRVLKDEGQYIFLEHEAPQTKLLKPIFNLLNPIWSKLTGGCNINRYQHLMIENEGFKIKHYKKGVFHYGFATKKEP